MMKAIGRRRTPDSSGVYPLTDWRYCPRKKKEPKSPKATSVRARLAPLKDLLRKNWRGRMGFFERNSPTMKRVSRTAAIRKAQSTLAEPQPFTPAWMMA